ncbi:hypothetical protein IU486_31685 [Streptomyces gardneri]|uniref:hypothetical protein n=1 Tax=Nocardia TaxID=1817 RepID=UPI00135733FE|nr:MULTISPECIES: hypothetical protein [Nocardia]MBF6169263.1 hypothetical protein [Streptomyces gardneri]MBF6207997.1 hypothetical protein [Streptomyces gardneri]
MAEPGTREQTLGALRDEMRRHTTQTVVLHSAVELVAVRAEVAVAPLFGELAALDGGLPEDDATLRTLLAFVRDVNAALARATSQVSEAHTG